MIKLAITDDHPLVIDGLLNALNDVPDIVITGTYNNGASLLSGLQEIFPDVLLLDLQLPDKKGTELVPILLQQYPHLHILILSGIESSPYIREMMQKGCKGYLLKSNTDKVVLTGAIREVHNGGIYLEASLKEQLLHEMLIVKRKIDKLSPRITRREREVLNLIMKELTNQEIADKLFISLRTVETHRYNLLQKLDARNTAGLLRIAREMGLE
ncbi:MAG: LuxR C-terminal-related transcriptional regulator [Flavipsychrobacter sp.]